MIPDPSKYDLLSVSLADLAGDPVTLPGYSRQRTNAAATANKTYLHFSGRLVVQPDTSGSYFTRIKRNLETGRCRYGFKCLDCPVFINYEIERQVRTGVVEKIIPKLCPADRDPGCPGRKKQVETGSKVKNYTFTGSTYNQVADRAAWLFHNSENRLLFITLTFPKFKRDVTENELNQAFSRYVENLKKNYSCGGYIAVREGDGVTCRYHYHLVCDLPFVRFSKLNRAWLHTISDFCDFSARAVTSDPRARLVRSTSGLVRYLCKYLSKSRGSVSRSRILFTDRRTAQALVKCEITERPGDFKPQYKTLMRHVYNDFCAAYTFQDPREHNKFIREVVLTWFGSRKSKNYTYHYPDPAGVDPGS